VFVQRPETLFAVQDWGWDSICYCCAGVTNPLTKPRYGWGKLFTGVFLRKWVSALADVDVILAAADDRAIDAFVARSGGKLIKDRIIKFPTRVDTSLFRPMDKTAARKELGINVHVPLIVNCGRINAVKDWKLLVDSFYMLSRNMSDARLVFVGDGEDRPKLEDYVDRLGLSAHVTITGFLPPMNVVKYFNAADVCAVSSHYEGWSVAMLEALACRKPIVSTAVSGARDMIVEGVNGYIVEKRDPKCFVKAMVRALSISEPEQTSLCIAEKYSLKNLSKDLATLWKPLA
jgi:glycosyltransferase involved in cell wall biosynthesis